jgi:hypothetical protein
MPVVVNSEECLPHGVEITNHLNGPALFMIYQS